MKKGFTLVELLFVVLIIGVITASSIIIFEKAKKSTESEEMSNIYASIQRGAKLYIDINTTWLESFNQNKEVFIKLSELQNTNYISSKIVDPTTGLEISSDYFVRVYIENEGTNKEYINSCVINYNGNTPVCITNSKGKPCECCDYAISASNHACN